MGHTISQLGPHIRHAVVDADAEVTPNQVCKNAVSTLPFGKRVSIQPDELRVLSRHLVANVVHQPALAHPSFANDVHNGAVGGDRLRINHSLRRQRTPYTPLKRARRNPFRSQCFRRRLLQRLLLQILLSSLRRCDQLRDNRAQHRNLDLATHQGRAHTQGLVQLIRRA